MNSVIGTNSIAVRHAPLMRSRLRTRFQIKIASEPWEFESIHRLNHRTFSEEIPQHPRCASGQLVDRFHCENMYVIAVNEAEVVGMVAVRGVRPFSLDAKVAELDGYLPPGSNPVEVRLLAITPEFRKGSLLTALLARVVRHSLDLGHDIAVISGTVRQLKLYRHLGFVPFAQLVGPPEARYQPMYLTLRAFDRTVTRSPVLRESLPSHPADRLVNLLPGPVGVSANVMKHFARPAISHRSPEFIATLRSLQRRLSRLVSAPYVQVIPGSGTLANAIVAAQLAVLDSPGIVISNGEFGDRLLDEARRQRLRHAPVQLGWGARIEIPLIAHAAADLPPGGWFWVVHHETSTGMLNPLAPMAELCRQRGWRLCVDCVSSMGAVPVDLTDVFLAGSSSGKGLGSLPGLALVFHREIPASHGERLPAYLDLGTWCGAGNVPFTHSSNLVAALLAAVDEVTPERMESIEENARWLRSELRALGFSLAVEEVDACAGIVTVKLASGAVSRAWGEELERRGFLLSFRSAHLLAQGWIQVSLLGNPSRASLEGLLHEWRGLIVTRADAPIAEARLAVGDVSPSMVQLPLSLAE